MNYWLGMKSLNHSEPSHRQAISCKSQIDDGLALVAGILEQTSSFALITRFLEDADALEEFAEDFEDLDDFYNSQFQTWQALAGALNEV